MDDVRFEWIKHVVYKGLHISEDEVFADFLDWKEGENEVALAKFLNDSPDEGFQMVLFYKSVYEDTVEELIKVPKVKHDSECLNDNYTTDMLVNDGLQDRVLDPDSEQLASQRELKKRKEEEMKQNQPDILPEDINISEETESIEQAESQQDDEDTIVNIRKVWRTRLLMKTTYPMEDNYTEDFFYLIRTTNGYVPQPANLTQAIQELNCYFEIGFIRGDLLKLLSHLMSNIYEPLLVAQRKFYTNTSYKRVQNDEVTNGQDQNERINDVNTVDMESSKYEWVPDRDEFLLGARKFTQAIDTIRNQLKSDIILDLPEIELIGTDEEIINGTKFRAIETVIVGWSYQIRQILETLLSKLPNGTGPLGLIDYWRERSLILGALIEQLKRAPIMRLIQLHKLGEGSGLVAEAEQIQTLYNESRDNVKYVTFATLSTTLHVIAFRFLALVERHFKTLTFGTSFAVVGDTLEPLMQALHMIWVLSRYYNRDENMVPLMERIATVIAEKVSDGVDVHMLLQNDMQTVACHISEAIELCNRWKEAYYTKRADIENKGRDSRWEFDKRKLFGKTDYIGTICSNIQEVAVVLQEFFNILGPELKSVTREPKQIDDLAKCVMELVMPFKQLSFDPLQIENKSAWNELMEHFRAGVVTIEVEAKTFIDDAFQSLRSAETALDVWLKFRNIRTRTSIHQLLGQKFINILEQYEKEIMVVEKAFSENAQIPPTTAQPPRARFTAPISGSIKWERHLLSCIKRPIVRMLKLPETMQCDMGKQVRNRYMEIGRRMKTYEDQLYTSWVDQTTTMLGQYLDQIILKPIEEQHEEKGKPTNLMSKSARGSMDQGNLSQRSVTSCTVDPEILKCNFIVNFDQELILAVAEAQQLEVLGFKLPSVVTSLAIKIDRYSKRVEQLKSITKSYHDLVSSLSSVEAVLLEDHLVRLRDSLKPAWEVLNWKSLSIPDYINQANDSLQQFASVHAVVQKIREEIEARLQSIASAELFPKLSPIPIGQQLATGPLHTCKEYFAQSAVERQKLFMELGMQHRSISQLLIKLEGVVTHTSSGEQTVMIPYYAYWEKRLFDEVYNMVVKNFQQHLQRIQQSSQPLFAVDLMLAGTDVVGNPQPAELYRLVIQELRDAVEATRVFLRWCRGTCRITPGVKVEGSEELYRFTFYEEIARSSEVADLVNQIAKAYTVIVDKVKRYQDSWRKHKSKFILNKQAHVERWMSKGRSTIEVHEKILEFENKLADLCDIPTERVVGCIQLRLKQLIHNINEHSRKWTHTYANQLYIAGQELIADLREEFHRRFEDLDDDPTNLDELKAVLQTIHDIRSSSLDVEFRLKDVQERYRLLQLHHYPLTGSELESVQAIEQTWIHLQEAATLKEHSLRSVKKKFTKLTKQKINAFAMVVEEFERRFLEEGPGAKPNDLDSGVVLLKEFSNELEAIEQRRQELASAETLFDLSISSYPQLLQIHNELQGLVQVFAIYTEQKQAREEWAQRLWVDLNMQLLQEGIEKFLKQIRQLPKLTRMHPCGRALDEQMRIFRDSLPLFSSLKHEAMRDRHWNELMRRTGQSFDINPETFTLASIFAMELYRFQDQISEIVAIAIKELSIEKGVREIEETWQNLQFVMNVYTKGGQKRGYLLGGVEEILQILDDNTMNLQSMASSRFVGPFLPTVQAWEKSLSVISEVLDIWLAVQRKWIYLEGIFIGGDIRSQLPDEAAKFDVIDKAFKKIMNETAQSPTVKNCCLVGGRLSELQYLSEGLERCQKSLNNYLDSKRNAFPRFFFISDDELLSILGSSDCQCVQEHIIKGWMFDNILSLRFSKATDTTRGGPQFEVTAMISSEGEIMEFRTAQPVTGSVEHWMTVVEAEMKQTNRLITKEAVFYYRSAMSRVEWMFHYQGMVVLATNQIWWTWEIEDVYRKISQGNKNAMKDYSQMLQKQLDDIVVRIRSPLSSNDRNKLTTVLTIDVHARDIVAEFVRDSVMDAQAFAWESQLRFYWSKSVDELVMRQCTGEFYYGYEYMGLNGRLVITPLTDRIYLTLTQALSMYLGGAPAGPAGTGKTETTKDLAKALGLLCMVTNCGEGMDYKAVGKILSGLCQCGAWGCFDEFNRIEASVLSVISTQLKVIQTALINQVKRFLFEGMDIKLDSRVGVFITMNPGYAGRTELPESVKALFRPVVVIVPDLQQICEIMLFSQGFLTAKVLAKKMTTLYKLAREQLSKQNHYDFGLRALKSVLVMAGDLRRNAADLSEETVLMRALRDMNLPKFIFEDAPLFLAMIQDLFPGLECPRVRYADFNDAVELSLAKRGYTPNDVQVDKVIQLYETMKTRHTTMVVGPTGGGKSVVIEALCSAQTHLGLTTKVHTLNPKDRSVVELYGVLDPNTRDWTDGLLSNIFREINKPTDRQERRYILFDGDVDALWVENMNSVMDDNRLLTLANGERIRLQPHCALLFEVGNLQYASPATVSRCGMVFVDPKYLGYEPYWKRWLRGRTTEYEQTTLSDLYDKYIPPVLDRIVEGVLDGKQVERLRRVIPLTNLNLLTQFCYLLDCLLKVDESTDVAHIEATFLFCLYFCVGGTLVEDERVKFDSYVKYLSSLPEPAEQESPKRPARAGELPNADPTLFEYYYDIGKSVWIPWSQLIPNYVHDKGKKFSDILVPTKETVRVSWLLEKMTATRRPLLLVGETGTSKTAICQRFLKDIDQDRNIILTMNFSFRTTSLDVQRNLETNVEKRSKDTYGPVAGKRLLIFVDDMNMPQVDQYGTQQPIALLKLLLERKGVYDRGKDLNWKRMQDLSYLASMGSPDGGRQEVDPRFTSQFSVLNVPAPSKDTLKRIYNSILAGHTAEFDASVKDAYEKITTMTLNLFR
ncbi:hypothetical protein P879_02503 [Paragonimus westermani]|uniref:AAA+ ATPase domain-containing protein n=1 Tax=Paragonimus westermani TaxID=34504 RepID=A0A8T0DMT1_9TREM|nr:hypothetical protein P879_02503 [Paragonimus westermani]